MPKSKKCSNLLDFTRVFEIWEYLIRTRRCPFLSLKASSFQQIVGKRQLLSGTLEIRKYGRLFNENERNGKEANRSSTPWFPFGTQNF